MSGLISAVWQNILGLKCLGWSVLSVGQNILDLKCLGWSVLSVGHSVLDLKCLGWSVRPVGQNMFWKECGGLTSTQATYGLSGMGWGSGRYTYEKLVQSAPTRKNRLPAPEQSILKWWGLRQVKGTCVLCNLLIQQLLNPRRSGGRIFFFGVNFLGWLSFRYPFHPRVTAVARNLAGVCPYA